MSLINGILVFATLASLIADLFAIIKGKRLQGVLLLLLFAGLVLGLILDLRHTAEVEARNKAFTDEQARARKLMNKWRTPAGGFNPDYYTAGQNEGIAAAAADLMEDIKCRPEASKQANLRITDAREQSASLAGYDEEISMNRERIWQTVSAAAYEQLRGVAEVPPNC